MDVSFRLNRCRRANPEKARCKNFCDNGERMNPDAEQLPLHFTVEEPPVPAHWPNAQPDLSLRIAKKPVEREVSVEHPAQTIKSA